MLVGPEGDETGPLFKCPQKQCLSNSAFPLHTTYRLLFFKSICFYNFYLNLVLKETFLPLNRS